MPDLASLRQDAASALADGMGKIDRRQDRDHLVPAVEEICRHFHTVAVATLLVDGNAGGFFLNLCRAAENWRRLLLHARKSGWAPPPASRNLALLGVIAAGDRPLAAAVAALSADRWQAGAEYEDAFLYAALLQDLARTPALDATALGPRIDMLESAGGDDAAGRVALLRSLAVGGSDGFDRAFLQLLLEHEALTEKRARTLTVAPSRFLPHRYLWTEGLALLRLAEERGIATDRAYLYCPPLARGAMPEPYRGDWVVGLDP